MELAAILYSDGWGMEEIRDLIRGFTAAMTARLDDHDMIIELRATTQNTLSQVNYLVAEIPKRYVTADQFGPIKERVEQLEVEVAQRFVTREQLKPIEKLVYGITAIMLASLIVGILSLVIHK